MTEPNKAFSWQDGQALKELLLARIEIIERTSLVTHTALERRLEAMNEVREALRDQSETFVTHVEHRAVCDRLERIERDIRELRESRAELQGKASQTSVMWAYAISLLGLIVGIVLHFV